MSWISGLAGKAEDFLNKVDKSAATALQRDTGHGQGRVSDNSSSLSHPSSSAYLSSSNHQSVGAGAGTGGGYSPYLTQNDNGGRRAPATRPDTLSPPNSGMQYSVSVPSNLYKMDSQGAGSRSPASNRRTPIGGPPVAGSATGSARQSPVLTSSRRDKDEELFEFLNSKDTTSDSPGVNGNRKKAGSSGSGSSKGLLNGHSRQSSSSSTTSTPTTGGTSGSVTGNKTPDVSISGGLPVPGAESGGMAGEKSVNGSPDSTEQTTNSCASDDLLGNHMMTEPSSGYISSQDDGAMVTPDPGHLSSLELENRLLKNEVSQLNQEMAAVIQRAREAQEELQRIKKKMEQQTHHLSHMEQVVRELRSQESDLMESLAAKDSQLGVLRVRLEEADKELQAKRETLQGLEDEKNRILSDHTSASGVHSQALDSLRVKLQDSEEALRREQDSLRKIQQESMNRQSSMEAEKQHLSQEVSSLQKKAGDDKVKRTELMAQLQTAKSQAEASKQELVEYKEKASRILQSKDKLIGSLKEGMSTSSLEVGGAVSSAELDAMRQERDMLREDVQRGQMTTDTLRTEIGDLEVQLQQDSDAMQEQISSLNEQFTGERERREDAEQEVNRQKQELRYAHEELLKQKTAFQHRIDDRESEISRLRGQLTTKNMSTSSQAELESRLHALTESLIQKQTMLEALGTEKNSLVLQLERMERQYREAESAAQRAMSTTVNLAEDDEVRNRVPSFMKESPLDGDVTRRVKRAANTIDRFSMKVGLFLRRYPMARVFVILYMALLHLWVSLVLLTYKPEIHGMDYQPRPPGPH